MFKAKLKSALGRRRIEALSLAGVAAIASLGLMVDRESPAIVTAPQVTYLNSVTPEPVREVIASAAGLPDIDHPRVESWVSRFTNEQRGSMTVYLDRMSKYEDMITKKLDARGLPRGLIYLAMIESGFNPTAKSPVKASGLWQFMSPTAREYGLTVSRRADERNNPTRSTDAALEYLSDLYDRFGSWYLAAAAYNTGQGRVARIMKQVTGSTKGTDADYYRISNRLPRETREYVPKMIAAARIGSDPVKYGFSAD